MVVNAFAKELFANIAIIGIITQASVRVYVSCIFWTIIYDTIYGYQDLEDDSIIGVKSTAIKFGNNPQKILYILAGFDLLFLILVGLVLDLRFIYFILALLAGLFLLCQIKTCDFTDDADCLKKFKSNLWVGIVIFLAIILG